MGISDNKSCNQSASSLAEDKAINSASMVDLAIICCFLDFQIIAPPPIVNTNSQRISYRYRETPRCPSIYIIDLNLFLLLFLLIITKQEYFSSLPKFLLNYIVFESILLLVVRPQYSENYIAMISCTWDLFLAI